jgi:hypothetical protein
MHAARCRASERSGGSSIDREEGTVGSASECDCFVTRPDHAPAPTTIASNV